MLSPKQIQDAIRLAGTRARRRVRAGELDPYRGTLGQILTQCLLAREVERALMAAMVRQAGLPAGTQLLPIPTGDGGWALSVNRPITTTTHDEEI